MRETVVVPISPIIYSALVELSALMPVIPGILAARPLKNLITERLRHE